MTKRCLSHRLGFSLVEILASLVVLGGIVAILGQITNSVTRTSKQSSRIICASTQAQFAFDLIGSDLAGLTKRVDVDFVAQNSETSGSDSVLLFLSSVLSPGISSSNNRALSVISYRVCQHPENKDAHGNLRPCLVRGGKAVPWAGSGAIPVAGFMGLKPNGLPLKFTDQEFPSNLLPRAASDFDMVGAGVLRMVIGFQLYPDNEPVTLSSGSSITAARGQIVYSPPIRSGTSQTGSVEKYIDLNRISALLVGIVTVDLDSLRLINAVQATAIGNAFGIPAMNQTPVQAWTATANSAQTLPGDIPLSVRQEVRVFERTYPITPFTSAPQSQ